MVERSVPLLPELLLLSCVPTHQMWLQVDNDLFVSKISWSWRSALLPQEDEISNWAFCFVLSVCFDNPSSGYPGELIHAFLLILASLLGNCLHANPFPSWRSDLLYIWHASHKQYFFHWSRLCFSQSNLGTWEYLCSFWLIHLCSWVEKLWGMCVRQFSRKLIVKQFQNLDFSVWG